MSRSPLASAVNTTGGGRLALYAAAGRGALCEPPLPASADPAPRSATSTEAMLSPA